MGKSTGNPNIYWWKQWFPVDVAFHPAIDCSLGHLASQLPGTRSAWQERAWCNPCRAWALVLPSDGWGVFCEASPQLRPLPRMDDFLPLEMGDFGGMCSFGDGTWFGEPWSKTAPNFAIKHVEQHWQKNVINNQEHDLLVPRPRGFTSNFCPSMGKCGLKPLDGGPPLIPWGICRCQEQWRLTQQQCDLPRRHQHAHVWPHRADPRDHGGGMARLCLNTRRKNSEMGNRVVASMYINI